jgi:hypothetical protein
VLGVVVAGGVATGAVSAGLLGQSGNFVNLFVNGRTLARVRAPDGTVLKLKNPHLRRARIEYEDGTWSLVLKRRRREYRFEGADAQRAAGIVVSRINRHGARRSSVQDAVRLLDQHGDPDAVIRAAAATPGVNTFRSGKGTLASLSAPTRLAVEMALHEEEERRALEGELWRLERAWEEAEEIAAISDDLLLPEGTEDFLERNRAGGEG